MKAISVRQPWANKIASKQKTIETRTWSTTYRGTVLICSSRSGDIEPLGCAVCVVDIVDCQPMTKEHEAAAGCEVYPRAQSWFFTNIRPIKPIPVKGSLGLFDCPLEETDLEFL